MDNWFDIVEPHQDIKDGDFDEVVFAAKLDEVVAGTAAPDYNDPYLFFKKTYFTDSITALLKKVEHKLTEGKGGSVVEIQTLFGGGKTHALVSIYHYIKSGDRIKDLLPQNLELAHAKIAVIVGTPLNPLEGRNTDSLTINTLWGDIAYQLAGMEGYRAFEKTDKERIAPGKDKLRAFLQEQQPFIILFDEILEYITKAIGVQYGKTNLGSQTYALLQELTETISSVEKGMMIVTLPSSYLEDFGEKKEEALARLSKIFGRVESIETPVKGEEVYSIISRRPFHETIDQSKKDRIIHEYFKLYQKNKDELPQKARDAGFNKKMELAYPFHPDVIDILNEKWGTFSSFQRTRGVLRLLANVVEDLYNSEKNIDIIFPSDINLEKPSIRQEFLRHIGSEYEGIIGSDIAGHDAKSQAIDNENKGRKHLAERVSTAVFFHSFMAGDSQKGIDIPYIKLATMHRDTIPSMVTEILQKLSNSLLESRDKIVTNLHYRLIVDKFLSSNVKVGTKTVLEQFYKDKDLPILASPEMLKRAIQNGISDAAFCLAYIKDDKIADDSFKFQIKISTGEITFDEHEYLLPKETCIKSKELMEKEKVSGGITYPLSGQPTVLIKEPPIATGGGIDAERGKLAVTATKYKKVVMKFEEQSKRDYCADRRENC
jgi:hypothetical protein